MNHHGCCQGHSPSSLGLPNSNPPLQGSALCLLGLGLCRAELPQEEKATPSAGLSGPLRMWKLSSPPEAEVRFGSAALVP